MSQAKADLSFPRAKRALGSASRWLGHAAAALKEWQRSVVAIPLRAAGRLAPPDSPSSTQYAITRIRSFYMRKARVAPRRSARGGTRLAAAAPRRAAPAPRLTRPAGEVHPVHLAREAGQDSGRVPAGG